MHKTGLQVVKKSEGQPGFVLLPRRWVVERSFVWLSRFRRLARDYERLSTTLQQLQVVASWRISYWLDLPQAYNRLGPASISTPKQVVLLSR